jgi:hypothetical protein
MKGLKAMIRFLFVLVISLYCELLQGSPLSAAGDGVAFFERRIRPILVEHCYECHSSKSKGGLRLDGKSRMLRGGDSGRAVVPGKPEDSLLVESIRYSADSFQMPPKGKLPESVIRNFSQWIKIGAPWPDDGKEEPAIEGEKDFEITAEDRAFWSFQPVTKTAPPTVRNASWAKNPIDSFILGRLEDANLEPAKQADKRRLLRRASFDLTGLPPTPSEIEHFLYNDSNDAFARVVNRLLDSPRYGERWGRHWFDGVRFVSDVGYFNFSDLGWKYRDWVVRALNSDMPYDDFLTHQIAGDLLPDPDGEEVHVDGVIATGVFAMGNYDDQESDKEKLYAEVIDDQIDLIGRQFLGLTLACARCHDHKFDPVSTADYYALGGIFMSSQVLETKSRIAAHRLKIPLDSQAVRKERTRILERIKTLKSTQAKSLKEKSPDASILAEQIEGLRKMLPPGKGDAIGFREGGYDNSRHKAIGDMPIYLRGNPYQLGEVIPRRIPVVFTGADQTAIGHRTNQSGRLELARWIVDRSNPFTARVMVNRIWQYHFGEGLVRTPSNFGIQGKQPSHPKLLDFLADRFMATNWSIKEMHRFIMNSATYQQATEGTEGSMEADPENILLSRFSSRRLSAEEVHDSLLSVSGRLQPRVGGRSGNRAIYGRVGHLYSSLVGNLFDAPATGTIVPRRSESTTALQALFMMNDKSTVVASRAFADRMSEAFNSLHDRIEQAYQTLFARKPSRRELESGVSYLERLSEEGQWAYYQVLLCSNELLYLD